jgi:hypothetical protein
MSSSSAATTTTASSSTAVEQEIRDNDLLNETITSIGQKLRDREVSSSSLTKLSLKRIRDTKVLNAFITVTEAEAIKSSLESDARLSQSELTPFIARSSLIDRLKSSL